MNGVQPVWRSSVTDRCIPSGVEEKCYLILLCLDLPLLCVPYYLVTPQWNHTKQTIFTHFRSIFEGEKNTKNYTRRRSRRGRRHRGTLPEVQPLKRKKRESKSWLEPFCVYTLPGHNVFKPLKRIPHPSMAVDCNTLQIDDVLHMWPHHEQSRWSNWSNVQATSRKHPFP